MTKERQFLSRRELFKLGLYGSVGVIAGTIVGNLAKDGPLKKMGEDLLFGFLFPDFNPFPAELEFVQSDHSYVMVHLGYQKQISSLQSESYLEYSRNTEALVAYADEAKELSIFALEERVYSGEVKPIQGQSPFDSALTMVTENREGDVETLIHTPDGPRRQNLDVIYSFLHTKGVKEIRLAGEFAWWEDHLGCLGIVAYNFLEAGFDIKGVEGAIYPRYSPVISMKETGNWLYPGISPEKADEVLHKLYNNTVKIPS